MAISKEQFDADQAAEETEQSNVIAKQGDYIAAVNAFIALPPVVDLTTEDDAAKAGLANLQAAEAALVAAQGQIPPPPPGP